MVENPRLRFFFIFTLLALGVYAMLSKGFNLGYDLKGGSRLVYRIDIEQAKKEGAIAKNATTAQVMTETLGILANRIDPNGILEASITQAGKDRILIELPGERKANVEAVKSHIEQLGSLEMRLVAYDSYRGYGDKTFDEPFNIEEEKKRLDKWLEKPEIKELIEREPGAITRYNLKAGSGSVDGPKNRYLRWVPMFRKEDPRWKENPKLAKEQGIQRWIYEGHPNAYKHFLPINLHEDHFKGEDLDASKIMETIDPRSGEPALSYSIKADKVGRYEDYSERNIENSSAIILNGSVYSAPRFISRITGGNGIITGLSGKGEVSDLAKILKTGALEVIPILDSETTIGASLGQLAIDKGVFSISLGAIMIVLFMLIYYRISGVIATLGLMLNVAMVGGIVCFIEATLTLPGLAGIVLTIGMAVDANILIFERIREERDQGKDLQRSVEAGFEKAMSTILDANITTFLTGMILYKVGIGPIKGFAVTLMVGIVTSVFCAIYFSRMVFHFLLAKGIDGTKMMQLFRRPDFRLLRLRKVFAPISLLLVFGGLFTFFQTDPATKYGIDFTGGAAIRVALNTKMQQKDLVQELRSDKQFSKEFENPIVNALGSSGDRGSSFEFQIKLKLDSKRRKIFQKQQEDAHRQRKTFVPPFISHLRRILDKRLARDPFTILSTPSDTGTGTEVDVDLNSSSPVKIADVKKALEKYQVRSAVGYGADGKPDPNLAEAERIRLELTMDAMNAKPGEEEKAEKAFANRLPGVLRQQLQDLKDAKGKPIVLSSPFPETELIGSRAVGDLQSAAVGAILFSLLVIVLYIRVRFHEFKYGIGACVALVHDVSITLGVIVLGNALGLLHAEIDLSMIAAFLTIIGYSLNDTIVVFDRIRENLETERKIGSKKAFLQIVDESVNQTLSRTVLTSLTTFLTLLCIFIFNHGAGSVLEGFSFAMLCGVVVGTYSSIWVANPIVVWLTHREQKHGKTATHDAPALKGSAAEGLV